MTATLHIEWQHSSDPSRFMPICPDTGRPLRVVIDELSLLLRARGVTLEFIEKVVEGSDMRQQLFFDGTPLEEIVPLRRPHRPCAECGICDGEEEVCPSPDDAGYYELFPESVVRLAALRVAGIK
jgi:hypothetical protein